MRIDDVRSEVDGLHERVRKLETQDPLGNASVSRGSTRFLGNESLKVIGSALISGWLIITGTLKLVGALLLEGVTTATGTTNLNGPVFIAGTLSQTGPWGMNGAGTIAGDVTQSGTYSVASGGKIIVLGAVPMALGATSYGAGIQFANGAVLSAGGDGMFISDSTGAAASISGGSAQLRSATGGRYLIVSTSGTAVTGPFSTSGLASLASLSVTGAKSFRMPHPSKPGHDIQHGSTESPVSGTEYTGEGKFDDSGECVIDLPDYFEAVNKPRNRTVQLTPVGLPFGIGADPIVGGKFTAYGERGRSFYWLAKAERFGGDFDVEPITGSGSLDDLPVGE